MSDEDEIRFYPRVSNLDNSHASIHTIDTPALLLNHVLKSTDDQISSSSGVLLVFSSSRIDLDSRINLYSFSLVSSTSSSSSSSSADTGISSSSSSAGGFPPPIQSVTLTKMSSVSVANFVPHPSCVVGAFLSPFRVDDPASYSSSAASSASSEKMSPANKKQSKRSKLVDSRRVSFKDYAQSILLNICGKLLLFQCDGDSTSSCDVSSGAVDASAASCSFMAPVIIASCVENVWIPPSDRRKIDASSSSHPPQKSHHQRGSHLLESLWLGCGHVGLKLWLPLNPAGGRSSVADPDRQDIFVSKRIIMTIPLQVMNGEKTFYRKLCILK